MSDALTPCYRYTSLKPRPQPQACPVTTSSITPAAPASSRLVPATPGPMGDCMSSLKKTRREGRGRQENGPLPLRMRAENSNNNYFQRNKRELLPLKKSKETRTDRLDFNEVFLADSDEVL